MKRTEKRERKLRRDDFETSSRPSFFSRAFFPASVVVALSVFIGGGSGCHSLFVRDIEHGRYFNGRDATSDWERARSESFDDRDANVDRGRILQAKASASDGDVQTTRGAVEEVSSADVAPDAQKKKWTSKMKDAFRFPFVGKTDKDSELENDLALSAEKRRLERERLEALRRERQAAASEFVNEESEGRSSSGLWTKLFPPKHEEAEDELIVGRSVEKDLAPKFKQKKEAAPLFSKKSPRQKPWNRPEVIVEQYDQSRFIPPMKTIEAYYSLGDVAVDRRAVARIDSYAYGDAATRDVSESLASRRATALKSRESEATGSLSKNSYRSNFYAPPTNGGDKAIDERLPAAPAGKRSGYLDSRVGSASLTPINSTRTGALPNMIAQTSGVARAKELGRTRPISSAEPRSSGGVASTSFTEGRPELDVSQRAAATPESLLRDAEAAPSVLESSNARYVGAADASAVRSATPRREVDDGFRESLGSQTSYEWFDSDRAAGEQADPNDPYANNSTELSNSSASFYEAQDSEEPSVLNESRFPVAADESSDFDRNSEANVADAFFDESVEGADGEVDLDVIVDEVIANAKYDESDHSVFSSSTVSGGAIASDLANAIMEGVGTGDSLENRASALSDSAPDSLVARKSDAVSAAPLTREEIAWIEQIKNAIQSLLIEREEHKRRGDDVRICDARLRLLYLVIGEYERSIQEIEDESDPLRVFWEKECRGLETLLQNQLEEIDPTFVAERLRSGLDSFSGLCQLRIRKTLLVESPACYGLFEERVDSYEPGEPLYAYAELDYVTSRETDKGFSIDVECRWRLLDSKGAPLTSFETQRCRNLSETKLRDVVLNVSVPLAEDIEPGVYLLELEVSDLNASKPETCVQRLAVRVADHAAGSDSVGANATY